MDELLKLQVCNDRVEIELEGLIDSSTLSTIPLIS